MTGSGEVGHEDGTPGGVPGNRAHGPADAAAAGAAGAAGAEAGAAGNRDAEAGAGHAGDAGAGAAHTGDAEAGAAHTGDAEAGAAHTGDAEAGAGHAGDAEAGAGHAGDAEAGVPAGEVTLDVVIDDGHSGRGRLTVLRLRWLASDPLAVGLHLSAQPDHPALPRGNWVVLRDFLRYGLEEPTGDGAVRIWPDELRDRVWFELERYGRPACISISRGQLREFLDDTDRQVPSGAERSRQALDELLARLLRSSP